MSESLVKSIFLPPFPSHLFTEGTPQDKSGSNTADRSRRGQSQGSRVKHKPSQWDLSAVELQQGTCSPTGVANCEHEEQEQAEKPARLLRSATGSTTALGWLCPVAEQPNTATHCKAPRSHPGGGTWRCPASCCCWGHGQRGAECDCLGCPSQLLREYPLCSLENATLISPGLLGFSDLTCCCMSLCPQHLAVHSHIFNLLPESRGH